VSAAQDLLSNHQHIIERLNLTTGSNGVFDVTVNDKVIYSKDKTGCHANPEEVLHSFEEFIGSVTHSRQASS